MPDEADNYKGFVLSERGKRNYERVFGQVVSCPCGEPSPKGFPPCSFERPCSYGEGHPRGRWNV